MRDSDDEDALRLDTVEDAIWKPWNHDPLEATTKRATALREFEHPLIGAMNSGDEIEAQVLSLALVVSRCRDEFSFGLGMELDASHRSVERAFSKT